MIESYLLLEDGYSRLSLEDGVSSLLINIEPLDHQWDGKILPVAFITIAHDTENSLDYLVTMIHRYNRSPARIYQYTCSLICLSTGITGVGDVWWDASLNDWYCKTSVMVKYRDDDGVRKNM